MFTGFVTGVVVYLIIGFCYRAINDTTGTTYMVNVKNIFKETSSWTIDLYERFKNKRSNV
jgi:hypothetical protein